MDEGFRETYIYVERILRRWGFRQRDILVYSALLLMPTPLSMREIAERTGLSISSVSTSLSLLLENYMVKVEKRGRAKVFTAIPIFYEYFLKQPFEILDKEVIPLKERLLRLEREEVSPQLHGKIRNTINDLEMFECILRKIIDLKNKCVCKRLKTDV